MKAVNKFSPLTGDFYAQCNALFRSLTNQAEIMLNMLYDHVLEKPKLNILSIGSGVGLFEVPMLQHLFEEGIAIGLFVGIDNDEYVCKILAEKISKIFGVQLKHEVLATPFQKYQTTQRFDLILFNHVFEYFTEAHLQWIQKSLDLRSGAGNVFIFSPQRGGINKIYGEMMKKVSGFDPFFADDISSLLSENVIAYSSSELIAGCDISLLGEADEHAEKIMLLSFLTQLDCREITPEMREQYSAYFTSLSIDHNHIPHPATLFVL